MTSKPSRPSSRPGARAVPVPAPLERGRAIGILGGLGAFAGGFAIAAGLVLGGLGGTPPYQIAVFVGLFGIGVVGYFLHRGTVPLPESRVWSPDLLRVVCAGAGVPATPVTVALYGLTGFGVLGNLLVPLILR